MGARWRGGRLGGNGPAAWTFRGREVASRSELLTFTRRLPPQQAREPGNGNLEPSSYGFPAGTASVRMYSTSDFISASVICPAYSGIVLEMFIAEPPCFSTFRM